MTSPSPAGAGVVLGFDVGTHFPSLPPWSLLVSRLIRSSLIGPPAAPLGFGFGLLFFFLTWTIAFADINVRLSILPCCPPPSTLPR